MVRAVNKYNKQHGISQKVDPEDTFEKVIGFLSPAATEGLGDVTDDAVKGSFDPLISSAVNAHYNAGLPRAVSRSAIDDMAFSAKLAGKGVSVPLSTLAGVGIDTALGDTNAEAWGKEIVTGGAGLVSAGVASLLEASTPIGWAIAGAVVINAINDWAREEFPEFKKFEDNIGKAVVDNIPGAKQIGDFGRGVGKTIESWF